MFHHPPRAVLVPVDFSDPASDSLRTARELLGGTEGLHVVHVLDELSPTEPGVIWGTIDDDARKRKATAALRALLAREGLGDVSVHVEIASGNPAYRITELADRLGVDLIVLPSHGRTGLAHITMGSVAERVVRLAPCAVLVLRSAPTT